MNKIKMHFQIAKRRVTIMRYMAKKYGVRYALRYRRNDQYWAG